MEQFLEIVHSLAFETNSGLRKTAESTYANAVQSSPNDVVTLLLQILNSTDSRVASVQEMASTLLRRELLKSSCESLWTRCDDARKQTICSQILHLFENGSEKIGKYASRCIDPLVILLDSVEPFWPQLLPTILRMANCEHATVRLRALSVLPDIIGYVPVHKTLTQNQASTVKLVACALQDKDHSENQAQACLLICSIAENWPKEDWLPFQPSIGQMISIIESLAQSRKTDGLNVILGGFNEVASEKPQFFKNEINRIVRTFGELCVAVEHVDSDVRRSAFEFLVTLGEKPKMCLKQCPEFATVTLNICMQFMAEIGDDPNWRKRMDDEEEDDDDENTVNDGVEGVDRLVQSIGIEECQNALVAAISTYVNKNEWTAKYAALTAIRQSIEYIQDQHVMDQMAELLVRHTDHTHMRLRYRAWFSLCQMATDQQPHFQDAWHERLMPLLVRSIDDPEPRVQQIALSFFVAFGEAMDVTVMDLYARGMMEKLMGNMQTANPHRGVLEETVTSIAVIAGAIEKDFVQYFDAVMPMLQNLIAKSTNKAESRLRGKAFECMILLGMAVGKERFFPDAKKVMEVMMDTANTLEASDIQMEYIKEAVIRICRCLKKDFKTLLPYVTPHVYATLNLERLVSDCSEEEVNGNEADIVEHNGKMVKIKTLDMEELAADANQLLAFLEEMEEEFYPEVSTVAKILLPYVVEPKEVYFRAVDARAVAFQCWAELIKVCMKSSATNPQALSVAGELLRKVCTAIYEFFGKYIPEDIDDLEELKLNACGLAKCLKAADAQLLSSDELKKMFELPMVLLKHTFEQRNIALASQREEDDEEPEDEDEWHQTLAQLVEAVGALIFCNPKVFTECAMTDVGQLLKMLFESTSHAKDEDLQLALYLTCDVIDHLKQASVWGWPLCMPHVLNSLHHNCADIRQSAAFAIKCASSVSDFSAYVSTAVERISLVLQEKKKFPRKHDDLSREAMDNMASALLQICIYHQPPAGTHELAYSKLPLLHDIDEGIKVHTELLALIKAQSPSVLGPNNAYLGTLIGKFAEIYGSEGSDNDLNLDIRTTFAAIPKERLTQMQTGFTEKQIKKIQRVLKELN